MPRKSDVVRVRTGQVAGRHGRAIREVFLDVLDQLLLECRWDEITVPMIARRAGRSPASFYIYFADRVAAVRTLYLRYQAADGERVPEALADVHAFLGREDLREKDRRRAQTAYQRLESQALLAARRAATQGQGQGQGQGQAS